MNRFKLYYILFIIISSAIILLSCGTGSSELAAAKNDASISIKQNKELNNTALVFAGKAVDQSSRLYKFSQSKYYASYSKEINSAWENFQKPNLAKISKWWESHSPKKSYENVLYPFSGPDIMNALTFFPDADSYIMFGLEHPGIVPDAMNMNDKEIINGLSGLKNSLGTILRVNFFRTEGMAKELGSKSFNGITGLIMFFLSMNGYEIIDARKIVINEKSAIETAKPSDEKIRWENPPKSRVPGVEINFRKPGRKIQTVRYYMLNVIDSALAANSPNFLPYLEKAGPYATVIKSASYLMHNDAIKFTSIRAAILSSSDYIVQDDSGVPLRYLSSDKWKVACHGYYVKPISLFANRAQKDLKEKFKKESTGILPFSYGYDYRKDESNLLTAEKIK